jgi:hypothetical protein
MEGPGGGGSREVCVEVEGTSERGKERRREIVNQTETKGDKKT